MALIHFLLVYNVDLGRLVHTQEFTDAQEASREYARLEGKHRGESGFEIVLVGADSLDTIKRTHGHYFDGSADSSASPYLAGV
jgi:hypothetical protein